MEKNLIFVVVAVVIGVLVALMTPKKGARKRSTEKPRKRRLMTNREQAMFDRLEKSLPDVVVLCQVAFGALMTARSTGTRNTFDRKIADFVLCNRAFEVLAVIELDDRSHDTKREQDAERDAMLRSAGYEVLRYANIPDTEDMQRDFKRVMSQQMTRSPTRRGAVKDVALKSRVTGERVKIDD